MDAIPRVVTSKRRIKYRNSSWQVHRFQVWSGELLCRVVVLKMKDSLLLWLGSGCGDLGEVAVGVPTPVAGGGALCSALLGGAAEAGAGASALARQLAAALRQPVFVCCGVTFDRFSAPLVSRGLIAEIKSRPDCF